MTDPACAFETGQYAAVVEALTGQARTADDHALLGVALLRLGQLERAELPLHRASVLGSELGQVEYGNLLRLLGRFGEACAHFETLKVQGAELKLRALRWWGVAEFQAGQGEAGLRRVEKAWHGYMAQGDDELTARVTQSLAQMHAVLGHAERAKLLLDEAIRALPAAPDPGPRLSALKTLLDLHLDDGDLEAARRSLAEARRTLEGHPAPRQATLILSSAAELYRLSGEDRAYAGTLAELLELAQIQGDHNLRVWVRCRLAEHQSLQGLHGQALETLLGIGLPQAEWPPELLATAGVLCRRRGDPAGGHVRLQQAAEAFQAAGAVPELIRARLHGAACALHLNNPAGASVQLAQALSEMLRLRQLHAFRPDFEELSELLKFATLDPELAPYMEPLLDRLAHLSGLPRLPEDGAIQLQLTTLGRVALYRDRAEIRFAYLNTPLLLVYLHLHPGQTRAEMQLALFPERGAKEAAGYLRQCVWDLRDKLGPEVVTFEGPHKAPRYRLGRGVRLSLDLNHFERAVAGGEVARAVALYRGEFMPGALESEWLLLRRDAARLALTFELRTQIARHQADGDQRRVLLLANQLLRADPLDVEVLQLRVEAARGRVPVPELARYVAQLGQALN